MTKQKITIIIICTLLAMALVAVGIVMWLLPEGGNGKTDIPANSTTQTDGLSQGDSTENVGAVDTTLDTEANTETTEGKETKPAQPDEPAEKPTIGIDVEIESEDPEDTIGSGSNFEIDFDDLFN